MRQIRVLQVVESLQAGGIGMVAVNLANELSKQEGVESYLVSLGTGGLLEKRISSQVKYLVLSKKSSIDPKAMWRLYKYFRQENFDVVHTHATSFYFPVLLKRFFAYKLVWHDHYGKKINFNNGKRENPIKVFARYFDHSFASGKELLEADKKFLNIKENKINYLPNFSNIEVGKNDQNSALPELKGGRYERVVCLANLRPQKDHINLLRAFRLVIKLRPTSYLYLVGKGNSDAYERKIKQMIINMEMQRHVKWLGSLAYPSEILKHCSIGVLSSESEGLPLAIIEYGLSNLAVVATSVGEIPSVLTADEHAMLVPPKNPEALAAALITLLNNKSKVIELQRNLSAFVQQNFSAETAVDEVMSVYHSLLTEGD